MVNREKPEGVPKIEVVKSDFLAALLAPGDEHSPFDGLPKDRRLETSSLVKTKEKELRALAQEMFGFMGEIIDPRNSVFVPKSYRDVDEVDGTTFCRAVVSLTKDKGKSHKYQLWVTERALIDSEGPVQEAERIDGKIKGKITQLLSNFIQTSETNVPKAASMREETLRELVRLAVRPIEVATITFQRFKIEGDRPVYESLLGVRLIRCVIGAQAYPVIFEGKKEVVCYQMPLLSQTTAFKVDDRLGEEEILGLVDDQVLKDSNMQKIFNSICDRALNSPESIAESRN